MIQTGRWASLLIVFTLTACSQLTEPTATAKPSSTVSPASSTTSCCSISTPPTERPTEPTATPPPIACNQDDPGALESVALTVNEIPKRDSNFFGWLEPVAVNVTDELESCGQDCVRVRYSEGEQRDGITQFDLTLTIIELDSPSEAHEASSNVWTEFLNLGSEVEFDESPIYEPENLPKNSRVGTRLEWPELQFLFTGSQESLFIEIKYEKEVGIEFFVNDRPFQSFVELQIEKVNTCYLGE
jgi:hypothetical protein